MFDNLIKPARALGFDPDRLKLLDALVEDGITGGLYPAAAYAVMRHGMVAAHGAFGHPQPDSFPSARTQTNTIFDIASLTKSFTGVLLMRSVERGKILLTQSLGAVLPAEAAMSPLAHITIKQLATHTSGLPAWLPLFKSPRSAVSDILNTHPTVEPGTKYTYSDLGYILLGHVVAQINSKPLDRLAHDELFQPLGMTDSGYNPPVHLHARIAATGHSRDRVGQTIVGTVHDENANGLGGVSGHAGIFSTVQDLCRFALAVQFPTTAAHFSIPQAAGVAARRVARESQIPAAVGSHGIGWFIGANPYLPSGDLASPKAYGHTGFTGTMIVFEPDLDLCMILLTNRVYMPGDGAGVLKLRRQFVNIVVGSIDQ